jgi:uroporphyrinogen-III synthase
VFIRELFRALEAAGIEYAVVGGVAVNIHGVPRMTYDVDIVVATSESSLRACREALEGLGLRCRLPFALETIFEVATRTALELERNLVAVTFTDPSNPLREVDVLVAPSLDPDGIAARAVRRGAGDVSVRVATVEDLIRMKRVANRPQDVADIAHLERIAKVTS